MNTLIPATLFCTLAVSGCTGLTEKPIAQPASGTQTEITQARGQLQQFAKIIDHMSQATAAEGSADTENTEKLNQVIARLDDPLQTLESSADESEKVRQLLAAADDISGNRNNLFSGLFVLFTQLVSSR